MAMTPLPAGTRYGGPWSIAARNGGPTCWNRGIPIAWPSSSSGAHRVKNEPDCLEKFGRKLLDAHVLDAETMEHIQGEAEAEVEAAVEQIHREEQPKAEDVYLHTYAASSVDAVYPGDYTGLPG